MNIHKITVDNNDFEDMTLYANEVLERPLRYTDGHVQSQIYQTSNDFRDDDTTLPIISDEFILNHDLTSNKWKDYVLTQAIINNVKNLAYPPMSVLMPIISLLETKINKKFVEPRGNMLYPINGYMGWHTNSDVPGIRLYLVYSPVEGGSYFKYVDRWTNDKPEIVTDWDSKGWTIRMFTPSDLPKNYLWHCIHAINAPRISFGFMLK